MNLQGAIEAVERMQRELNALGSALPGMQEAMAREILEACAGHGESLIVNGIAAISRKDVGKALGISRQAVSARVGRGSLRPVAGSTGYVRYDDFLKAVRGVRT